MTRLGDVIDQRFGGTPTDFREALGAYGDVPREQLSRAAMDLAGTTDRSSKAYRNARRNLERYRQGVRRPSAASLERLQRGARRRRATGLRGRGAGVTVSGELGPTPRPRGTPSPRDQTVQFEISEEEMEELLDAWVEGGGEAAAGRLESLADEHYELSHLGPEWGWDLSDAEGFDVEPI